MEGILNRIIEIRKSKKISQKDIAKHLGITQAAYAKVESGTTITVDRLYKIAESLNVSVNDILNIKPINTENEKRLMSENERLRGEVENLELLISFLKERNMITSPQTFDKGELFDIIESMDDLVKESIEDDKQIMEEIQNNSVLKAYLEDGAITTGRHYHVWKEFNEKK